MRDRARPPARNLGALDSHLLRVGSFDEATPIEDSERIAAVVQNARLDVVPGVGHAYFLEDLEAGLT
jgi:pimeloyl-ACP methyl ester carboxylesterase